MKTILFPTDFSENANKALKFALEIAKKSKSKLILFHAFWVPVYQYGTPPEMKAKEKRLIKDSLKALKNIQNDVSLKYPSVVTETLVTNGFTADSIVEASEKTNADLIIMGTKGATGLKELIMGSNTVDVIHKSKIPVLVVPQDVKEFSFTKFVFATDFHEADINKIEFLVRLAALFEAEITVVHVTEDDFVLETADKAIIQHFKKDVRVKTHYEKLKYKLLKGEVVEELEEYLQANKVNLIAVVNSSKQFLTRVFGKSITQKMAFHSKIPLLVLQE